MDEEHNAPVRIIIKKKKGGHGGGHSGGAWKVAYADFVTAMMALFIVLWIVGQSTSVKQAISMYFKDPGVFTSGRAGGILEGAQKTAAVPPPPVPFDNAAAEMAKLKAEAAKIESAISETPEFKKFIDKIHLTVTEEGLRIDLVEESEGLFFDIGKAQCKPETVKLLKVIATHLADLQNWVVVEGYTDARPYVTSGYSNWNLSTDRANSARTVMEAGGLRKNQIIQVRGFADRKLRVPDKPMDFSNRRVSILVPSKQFEAPVKRPGIQGATPSATPAIQGAAPSATPGKIDVRAGEVKK
jgi:chemotaxis protein MotB